jgi:ABC-type transport system involved in multi-copper enzyme maturation permease subunit
MFFNLYAAERIKIFKRALIWVSLGLLLALILFDMSFTYHFATTPIEQPEGEMGIPLEIQERAKEEALRQSSWPWSFMVILGHILQMGWLVVFVIVGSVVAQEYTWRSLHLWLGHGVPRPLAILVKFSVVVFILLIVVLTPVLVGGPLSAFFTFQLNGALDLTTVDYVRLILGVVSSVCSLLPYAALAYLLAVLSKSTFVPIGGGVAFFILENVLASKDLPLTQYLPCSLVNALSSIYASIAKIQLEPSLNPNLSSAFINPPIDMLSPEWAFLGIILWTIMFLGFAIWVFQRQDLTE